MDATKNKWDNKVMTVCGRCRQNIRIPVSYKPLIVTCPKCRNEFHYEYLSEFGNHGEFPAGFQIQAILPVLMYLVFLGLSIVIAISSQNVVGAIVAVAIGTVLFFVLVISPNSDYATFFKYRPVKWVLMNRQGIISFNQEGMAVDCLNWSDVRSVKYLFVKRRFTGKIENEGRPVSVEMEVSGKGTVRFPPTLFFSDEQRKQMIDQVSTHLGTAPNFRG